MGEVESGAARSFLNIEVGEWGSRHGGLRSGKSTLMHLIRCLDSPTRGSYLLDGTAVETLSESELAVIRNARSASSSEVQLIPRTSALKQVMVRCVLP
jgi:putative ABC transport system ATP-binding protein